MGNALPRAQATNQDLRTYLLEYTPKQGDANLVFKGLIGGGKFIKAIHAKSEIGDVVVKVYIKRDVDEDLSATEKQMEHIANIFSIHDQPNIIPYQEWQESSKSSTAFLVRQYFASNLYDRLSTRPFLMSIEKKWLAYQLLQAVVQLHKAGICHGDVKSENIMVTSWSWLFLTDIATFKPTYLPEDDPADFYYYFAGDRKRCYLAPERFYKTGQNGQGGVLPMLMDSTIASEDADTQMDMLSTRNAARRPEGQLRNSMDIFSVGCVIGELFGRGEPLFDLPALLRYRTGDSRELEVSISKLEDPVAQHMVKHMLNVRASERFSAADYLAKYGSGEGGRGFFPSYFEHLFSFMAEISGHTPSGSGTYSNSIPDDRIIRVCAKYDDLLHHLAGISDPIGTDFFQHRLSLLMRDAVSSTAAADDNGFSAATSTSKTAINRSDSARENLPPPTPVPVTPSITATWSDERTLELLRETEQFLASIGHPSLDTDTGGASASVVQRCVGGGMEMEMEMLGLGGDMMGIGGGSSSISRADVQSGSNGIGSSTVAGGGAAESMTKNTNSTLVSNSSRRPLELFAPSLQKAQPSAIATAGGANGLVMVLSLLCSMIRHVLTPQVKLTALLLLVRLGTFSGDESRLQRLVPFVVNLLGDQSAIVRAAAVRGLCKLLSMVTAFPPVDAGIFPQYVLPALQRFPSDPEEMVRIAFAECLPCFAETSRRFLDIAHHLQLQKETVENAADVPTSEAEAFVRGGRVGASDGADGKSKGADGLRLISASFDKELARLHHMISRLVVKVTALDTRSTGSSALVKRALLRDVTRLCIFFGREMTLDVVLPQLITFLNDRDNALRGEFFDCITGVCTFVGASSVEEIIMPCIEMTLIDVEERVIAKVVHCLSTLCELGLFRKSGLVNKAKMTAPLLFHPSPRVRHEVVALMSVVAAQLGSPDMHAFLAPVIRPFCKPGRVLVGSAMTYDIIKSVLKPPVSRKGFDDAMWAAGEWKTAGPGAVVSSDGGAGASASAGSGRSSGGGSGDRNNCRVNEGTSSGDGKGVGIVAGPGAAGKENSGDGGDDKDGDDDDTSGSKGNKEAAMLEQALQVEEQEKLELMRRYISTASHHMRAKIHLWQTQAAKEDKDGTIEEKAVRQYSRTLQRMQHTIWIPDQHYVPLHSHVSAQQGSGPSSTAPIDEDAAVAMAMDAVDREREKEKLEKSSKSDLDSSMEYGATSAARSHNRNSSMSSMAGDSAELDASTSVASQRVREPTVKALVQRCGILTGGPGTRDGRGAVVTEEGAAVVVDAAGAAGGQRKLQAGQAVRLDAKVDPAFASGRALQARIASLDVPSMPPEMGRLRMRDHTAFSIYKTSSSVHPSAAPGGGGSGILGEDNDLSDSASGSTAGKGSNSRMGVVGFSHFDQWWRDWRPREGGVLLANLHEHTAAINKIAVSQDHTFFATGSNDGTVKIWESRRLQRDVGLKSRLTYSGQSGMVTDLCMCDNSHSVASASSNGSVHVFKVEYGRVSRSIVDSAGMQRSSSISNTSTLRVVGTSMVRKVDAQKEGAVLLIRHYTTYLESVLVYATQMGHIHGWDLRHQRETWLLRVSPDLGFLTALVLGPSKCWLAAGTSRGFITVWDLRFKLLVKCWRHSSHSAVKSLHVCPTDTIWLKSGMDPESPLVYAAVGDNEVTTWDLSSGHLRQVFRSVQPGISEKAAFAVPHLEEVRLQRSGKREVSILPLDQQDLGLRELGPPISHGLPVQCMLPPPSLLVQHARQSPPFLVTAGMDRHIRYWDLHRPTESFVTSGLEVGQPRPCFMTQQVASSSREGIGGTGGIAKLAESDVPTQLFICQDPTISSGPEESPLTAGDPNAQRRGPVPPCTNHNDCVLDLQILNINPSRPLPLLLSAGRDGVVKVWR